MSELYSSKNLVALSPFAHDAEQDETNPSLIERAYLHARETGTSLDRFLIDCELVRPELLYQALAQILELPFTTQTLPVEKDADGLVILQAEICALHHAGKKPIFAIAPTGHHFVALLQAASAGMLQLHYGAVVVTTPQNFIQSIRLHCGQPIAEWATQAIEHRAPQLSAAQIMGPFRMGVMIGSAAVLAGLPIMAPPLWHMAIFALTLFPGVPSIVMKTLAIRQKLRPVLPALNINDRDLPTYTVLVPLYRESRVIPKLIERLLCIDYPRPKLEIKLLVEMDDIETRLALIMQDLPPYFDVVICPLGHPRTKPRALNIGLAYAKGEHIVVYDAEDEPDPDQLRKAASRFTLSSAKLGCVQACLAIDNRADSWITRMFSLEYAGLFDALLPGMAQAKQPIPLGGTSNHFRRSTLTACLAWDPWNVTEDADLGLRLARLGYETAIIDSTTWEEAPNSLRAWTNQRTRWLKGWMQTTLVLTRSRSGHRTSLSRAMHFQIMVVSLASVTSSLFHPILLLLIGWLIAPPFFDALASPFALFQWSFVGTVFMGHSAVSLLLLRRGARRRGWRFQMSDGIGMVVYSLLKCFSAWRALWELMVAPSHWRKTDHGHARTTRRGSVRGG